MTWEHNGYTWNSGWFIDEHREWGNGDDYLIFSPDGLTTRGYGVPGLTFATNWSETKPDGT